MGRMPGPSPEVLIARDEGFRYLSVQERCKEALRGAPSVLLMTGGFGGLLVDRVEPLLLWLWLGPTAFLGVVRGLWSYLALQRLQNLATEVDPGSGLLGKASEPDLTAEFQKRLTPYLKRVALIHNVLALCAITWLGLGPWIFSAWGVPNPGGLGDNLPFWGPASGHDLSVQRDLAEIITLLLVLFGMGLLLNVSIDLRSYRWLILLCLGPTATFWLLSGYGDRVWLGIALWGTALMLIVRGSQRTREVINHFELRRQRELLMLALQRESAGLQLAAEQAEQANQMKSRFLAAASHDLRQPVTALGMLIDVLARRLPSGSEERRLTDRLRESQGRLQQMLNSLLDLSRLQSGVISPKPKVFQLSELVATLFKEIEPQAAASHIVLRSIGDRHCLIFADPMLVETVLRNLLSNAVKASDGGTITVRWHPGASDKWVVAVSDTGQGISAADQRRIFDEFVQLDNPSRIASRGIGLGLSIVRRIDQMLSLELRLDSEPGMGASFSFLLPAASDALVPEVQRASGPSWTGPIQAYAGVTETPTEALTSASPGEALAAVAVTDSPSLAQQPSLAPRILVVEDDASLRLAYVLELQSWGYQVEEAACAEHVAQVLRSGVQLDAVILDDMLHGDTRGLELAQDLCRRMPADRVLMVTGNTHPERLRKLSEPGFEVLIKPVQPDVLLRWLLRVGLGVPARPIDGATT